MARLSCCGKVVFETSLLLAMKKSCTLKLCCIAAKSEKMSRLGIGSKEYKCIYFYIV